MKENFLERERQCYESYAAFSSSIFLTSRKITEYDYSQVCKLEYRLPFQRDRDRIVHSRAFRRLMHKTQIFNANKGDHYRNRLTHTLEVCQIARSIGKILGLNDELIEAIALGHDVGHSPFGHMGERTLHRIISGQIEDFKFPKFAKGFKHNFQSVHLLENLEKSDYDRYGLNLTTAVLDGILKHTKTKYKNIKQDGEKEYQEIRYSKLPFEGRLYIENPPITLEGQVVAIADEIAQVTHDLEDGIRAGIIRPNDIYGTELIRIVKDIYELDFNKIKETVDARVYLIKYLVGFLIDDVCKSSIERIKKIEQYPNFDNIDDVYHEWIIGFSDEKQKESLNIKKMQKDLLNLITELIISSQEVSISDAKAEYIIKKLFKAYYMHPQQLPDHVLKRYFLARGKQFRRMNIIKLNNELKMDLDFIRLICDHIGSMTDQYASREYYKLYEPDYR